MVVILAAYCDARPGGFLDVHTGPVHGSELAHEMPRKADAEVFDLADGIAGKGEDRVLLRIGGDDLAVVAGLMRIREVPGQGDADVEVLDVVYGSGSCDPNDVRLGLPVLVVAEDDRHVPL